VITARVQGVKEYAALLDRLATRKRSGAVVFFGLAIGAATDAQALHGKIV